MVRTDRKDLTSNKTKKQSSRWQKIAPARANAGGLHLYRPAADSRGLRLRLPPCTRPSTLKGYVRAGNLSAQSHLRTAEMRVTLAAGFIKIRLRISVYHKWTIRLKILILYSQKFHRTKFLISTKRRNRPLFRLCGPPISQRRLFGTAGPLTAWKGPFRP